MGDKDVVERLGSKEVVKHLGTRAEAVTDLRVEEGTREYSDLLEFSDL